MADLTKFNGGQPFTVTQEPEVAAPEVQLAEAMRNSDINPPAVIHLNGKVHRFSPEGRKDDDAGWYVGYPDGVPAGTYGNWRTGATYTWKADIGRALTRLEEMAHVNRIADMKKLREAETKRKHEVAADSVLTIWNSTEEAPADHPYLVAKGVKPHGIHVTGDGRLVLPLYDMEKLTSLQYIDAEGGKRYHPGGAAKGSFWFIGDIDTTGQMFVAEGFATAATIHELTGKTVMVAYSAGNLEEATGLLREMCPEAKLTIVADNDENGAGERFATKAALAHNAEVVMPPVLGDANDFAKAGGKLKELLLGPEDAPEYLLNGNEFLSKPKPVKWLIKRWLQANAMAMVYGPSGSGKTFVVLDWILHLVTGQEEWFGHKVHECDVVYLCGEGHHGMYSRISAWATEHQVTDLSRLYVSTDSKDLDNPMQLRKVIDEIHKTGNNPELIVIDTLNCFFSKDENSSQDTRLFLLACKLLMKEFNCAIILVHHTGVNAEAQDRARGSSAWRGAMDIQVGISPFGRDGLILTQWKVKDGERLDPMSLELKKVEISGWFDDEGEQISSVVVITGADITYKHDKALDGYINDFTNAWRKCGGVHGDYPFIDKQLWKNYLMGEESKGSKNADKMLQPKEENRLVGRLVTGNIIQTYGSGFIVTDPALAGSLMITRSYEREED